MFGKKNFTNTQIKGRIVNPDDDLLINTDSNNLTLFSKYKVGSRNLSNKSVMEFRDSIDNIKLYQSPDGLLDTNGNPLSNENKHLEDGLVVWVDKLYNNSTGFDKSGAGNTLTINNMTEEDGLLKFNGITSSVDAGTLDISAGNLSISCWVKPTAVVENDTIILGKVNTGSDVNDWKLWAQTSNSWAFEVNSGGIHNSSIKLVNDDWNHLVATFNPTTNLVNLYTNGSLNFSNTETAALTYTQPLVIGDGNTADNEFEGYMRDIRVYDREISGSEIVDLYNIGAVDIKDAVEFEALELPEPNIYLKMREGAGSVVANYGNDNILNSSLTNDSKFSLINNKSCVKFDGTDDDLLIESSNIDIYTNDLTISFWAYQNTLSSSHTFISNDYRHAFDISMFSTTIIFFHGNTTNFNSLKVINDDVGITSNTWNHMAFVRDSEQNLSFYLNGKKHQMVKHLTNVPSLTISSTNANITVGQRLNAANNVNGFMNNVRIYNSELTEKQIQKIYREELNSSSTLITDNYTSDKIKTIAELRNPENDSDLNDCLIMNLTGRDNGTTTYVNDYSLNRYNAAVATGTLTYTSTDASTIQATNVLSFNGSTYLAVDGTLGDGYELEAVPNQYNFSGWIKISSLASNNPIFTTNKDKTVNGVYCAYVDTTGNLNLLRNNTDYDLIKYNTGFGTSGWYHISINNYGDKIPEVYSGTDTTSPTLQTLVSTSTSGVTYVSNTNVKIANGLDTSGSPNGTNFSGKMDDIKLYSKALTLDEIVDNWNSGDVSYYQNTTNTDGIIKLDGEPSYYANNNTTDYEYDESNSLGADLYLQIDEGSGTTLTDSGTYNNGSITGGSWSDDAPLYFTTVESVSLDGTDDYIQINNDSGIDLSGAITISTWIKPFDDNNNDVLFSKAFFGEFDCRLQSTDDTFVFYNGSPDVGEGYETWTSSSFTGILNYNSWNHFALTRDTGDDVDKDIRIYVNGIQLTMTHSGGWDGSSSSTENFAVTTTTNNIRVGSRFNGSLFLRVKVADFRIYTSELSSEQINTFLVNRYKNLSDMNTTISSVDDNLSVAFTGVGSLSYNNLSTNHPLNLKLNEGSGTIAFDRQSYNNGTLNGGTWTNKNTPNNDNSLYFDGTDDYIEIANDTSHNLAGALSISLLFKPLDISSSNQTLCVKSGEFELVYRPISQTDIRFVNNGQQWLFRLPDKFQNKEWMHIVITRDKGTTGKTVKCFVNTEPLNNYSSPSTQATVSQTTNNIKIGVNNSSGNYVDGYISQFRIYKYELKHSEILDIYNYTEGWTSMAKYGNFSYDLNTDRKLTITTSETNNECSGELWIKPMKTTQQTVLKSDYTTRANGDIKLELVPADSNNSNLIANWQLFADDYTGGNVIDYSGNGTDLTISSLASSDKFQGLNYNNSVLLLDGTDSNISLESSISSGNYFYDNMDLNNFTITCWINMTNLDTANGILTILQNDGARNSNDKIIHLVIPTDGEVRFQTVNSSLSFSSSDSTGTISINEWNYLAFSYDNSASPKKKIYINGENQTVTNNSPSDIQSFDSSIYVAIGRGFQEGNNMFAGSITDLRIYNKTLTEAEIREVMRQNMKAELSIQLGGSVTSISNNNAIINPATWSHFAYNYSSTLNELRLYMNGEEIAQNLSLTNTTSVNSNIVLGDQSFEGQINNFTAYSRNLTQNEIKRIYLGFDRLKLHLVAKNESNSIYTSDTIILNKANKPANTFITPYGSGLTIVDKDGPYNNVMVFDGSTAYIELDPESDLWRGRSFTIAVWIKPDDGSHGTSQHIFSRYLSSSYQSYYIAYDYTAEEIDVFVSSGGTDITSSFSVLKGSYTHVAVVFENRGLNIYLNGNLVKFVELPYGLDITIDSTLKTVIGDSSDLASASPSTKYEGRLYDFRYYDTSLSKDAIRAIYSGFDLNNSKSITSQPELDYIAADKTTNRNKDFVQPSKSSLVLHLNNYTTGSTIASSTENGLTATATSMTSSTSDFDFNGSSSYLSIADNSDLNISGTTLSISMWINPSTLAGSTYRLLMKGSTDDYGLYINSSNKVVFNLTSSVTATSTTALTTGNWYNITALYDGTNMDLYINGTDDTATVSGSIPASVPNTGTTIYIGATTTTTNYYNGNLRDIRIYNTAISEDDIKLIYNAGITTTGELSIAGNKVLENANKYGFVSKYLIDDNGETTDVLGNIARDSLLAHYDNTNSGTVLLDQSTTAVPGKMTSLRPAYLNSSKLITLDTSNGTLSSTGIISASNGTVNTDAILLDGNTTSNIIISGAEDEMVNDWSFSTWYKLTSPSAKNVFLSRKETSKNFDIFIDNSDNEFKFKYNTTTVSSNLAIDTNDKDWHHLAVTKGQEGLASNIISFYHDGKLVNQRNEDIAFTTSATDLIIGTDNTTGFNGYLDDIRLYNTKLNHLEVAKISRSEFNGGPVHYWLMEDDSTDKTVRDLGSAGNNLRLQGTGATFDTTSTNVYHGTRSLKFEGTTSNYASSASSGVLGATPRCVGMWIKRSISTDEAADQELVAYGNSATAGEQFSVVINTASNVQVNIGSTNNIRGTTRLNDTDWHHITVLQLPNEYYSDDRAIKIFVDGNECTDDTTYTSTSINTKITGASDLLSVGKKFKGYINEMVMYNYSLTQPELDILYANKNHYMLNLE